MERILIGCSGWFYMHWSGVFYPKDMPTREWFKYYSSNFDTVELNSTFYSFPNQKRSYDWYKSSPQGFGYSIKMNREITHLKRLLDVEKEVQRFREAIEPLKEKLVSILVQLPPSFRYTEENVKRVTGVMMDDKKMFVEFRHPSWYTDQALKDIEKKEIKMVTVSMKGLPFRLPEGGDVYIRMHGDVNGYATDYSEERLNELGKNIVQGNYHSVYVYFNNDYHGYAPKNALFLKSIVEDFL
jgi:uncharacterized protein YecE (DUF72 family)